MPHPTSFCGSALAADWVINLSSNATYRYENKSLGLKSNRHPAQTQKGIPVWYNPLPANKLANEKKNWWHQGIITQCRRIGGGHVQCRVFSNASNTMFNCPPSGDICNMLHWGTQFPSNSTHFKKYKDKYTARQYACGKCSGVLQIHRLTETCSSYICDVSQCVQNNRFGVAVYLKGEVMFGCACSGASGSGFDACMRCVVADKVPHAKANAPIVPPHTGRVRNYYPRRLADTLVELSIPDLGIMFSLALLVLYLLFRFFLSRNSDTSADESLPRSRVDSLDSQFSVADMA